MKKAAPIFKKLGMEVENHEGKPRKFTGVGQQPTLGTRRFPWGIKFKKGQFLRGSIRSKEMEKDEPYMLLSLFARGALGMVKDVSAGTYYLKKYQLTI